MALNVLVSLTLAVGLAQAPAAQSSSTPATTAPAASAPSSDAPKRQVADTYVIGANDVLSISCRQDPAVTGKYRVDEGGSINMPYIGRVAAGGKTIAQLQLDLVKGYNDYIRNPELFVDVDSYKSQSVMVGGAVRAPQRVEMRGQLTLLDALAAAGSPTADAGDDIQIAHHSAAVASGSAPDTISPDDPSIQHVKRSQINLGRNNIVLQDGDIIYVTPAQHFTLAGYVRTSGSYIWTEGMTLDQALALAGGLQDRGSMGRIKARRMVNGKMTDVDLKAQDKVQPGDVITVGARMF